MGEGFWSDLEGIASDESVFDVGCPLMVVWAATDRTGFSASS